MKDRFRKRQLSRLIRQRQVRLRQWEGRHYIWTELGRDSLELEEWARTAPPPRASGTITVGMSGRVLEVVR